MVKRKVVGSSLWIIPLASALVLSIILNVHLLIKSKIYPQSDLPQTLTVTRVIDGDTFDTDNESRVRLAGADAPEYPKDCLSEQAKKRLDELIIGKKVEIKVQGKDQFGRLIGFILLEDLLIDKILVEEGLATAIIDNPKYGSLLTSAQEEAQKTKRGIWSDKCLGPPSPKCNIKGNVRSDLKTKVYHLPECFNYNKIVIDNRSGDRWFCSEREAREARFRKSEDCPNP